MQIMAFVAIVFFAGLSLYYFVRYYTASKLAEIYRNQIKEMDKALTLIQESDDLGYIKTIAHINKYTIID